MNAISNEEKVVKILWTGGYDSTFRVVQLSRCEVEIQPFYMASNRKSQTYELRAIEMITQLLKSNEKTKCRFAPLTIVEESQREKRPELIEAYRRVMENDYMGPQYIWLGSFAQNYPGIELSVHEDDKAISVIKKYGKLILHRTNAGGGYYVVDCENSSHEICLLFQYFHFPLVDYTKLQMKDYYINNGYEEVMKLTWFCHTPIDGKPCGTCNPCRYTIEEGLKERFTKKALFRYYKRCIKDKIYNLIHK